MNAEQGLQKLINEENMIQYLFYSYHILNLKLLHFIDFEVSQIKSNKTWNTIISSSQQIGQYS